MLGYGLAALTKLVFPLALDHRMGHGARFADRIGKGIRGAPRDALIADLAPPEVRGASFGLRQALDTVGGFGGPLARDSGAWRGSRGDFRRAFWVAVVPALHLRGCCWSSASTSRSGRCETTSAEQAIAMVRRKRLPRNYWIVVAIAAVFTLARFSEAFLILRARDVGFAVGSAPWVMVVMSVVYAAVSYPAGAAADRGRGARLLSGGLIALFAADLVLALAANAIVVLAGAALWGLHMGLTQGLLAALVAAAAPADLRGTAFGVFNLVCGIALLAASALAGWLWDAFGPPETFYAGAAFTAIAWIGLRRYGRRATELRRA